MLAIAQRSDQPINDRTSVMARKLSQRKITTVQQLIPADARLSSEAMKRWSRAVTQSLLNFAPVTTKTMRDAVERIEYSDATWRASVTERGQLYVDGFEHGWAYRGEVMR